MMNHHVTCRSIQSAGVEPCDCMTVLDRLVWVAAIAAFIAALGVTLFVIT
jgi:hypothetical protein